MAERIVRHVLATSEVITDHPYVEIIRRLKTCKTQVEIRVPPESHRPDLAVAEFQNEP